MTKSELYSSSVSGEDSFTEFKRDVSQRSDFASEPDFELGSAQFLVRLWSGAEIRP